MLEPPETVGWNEIVLFLKKALKCSDNASCFDREQKETLVTELQDYLNLAVRLDEGFCGEWDDKEPLKPSDMPVGEMRFPF